MREKVKLQERSGDNCRNEALGEGGRMRFRIQGPLQGAGGHGTRREGRKTERTGRVTAGGVRSVAER